MSCVKREKDRNTVLDCKSILLDIEGTTSSIAFVKDVLFPYVRVNLQDYINKRWDSDSLQEIFTALRSQAKEDGLNNIDGVVIIPEDGTKEELIEAVIKNVFWLMDNDRKTKSLKDLQGLIMEEGYVKGDIKGHVYDDVGECLKSWRVQNKSVYIYSSGSVHAQKLLFGHSIQGDLLQFISGHFDTSVGPKGESTSYKKILEEISCSPNEVAFFTDVPGEARAAKEAGLSAILLSREGNTPLTDEDKATFPVISSFEVIEFESTSKKLKLCTDTDVNIEDNKSINNCPVSDDIQTNSDNPKSDGDVQMSDEADSCQSITDKNNGTVTEQLCQDSKLSPVKLDSSSMETCNRDEEMLEVPSLTENKEDDLREDNKVQISHHETNESAKSDDPSIVSIKEIHEQKSTPLKINNCEADDDHEKNHDIVHQEASRGSEHKDEALKSLVNENEKSETELKIVDNSININGSTTETSEKGAVQEMSSVNHEKMLVNLDTKELKSDLNSQSQANSDHLMCENDLSMSNMSKLSKCEESQTKLDNSMEVSESVESEQKLEIKVEQTNFSHSVSESMPIKCSMKLPKSNEMLKSHLETDKTVSECTEINGDLDKEIETEKSNGMPKMDEVTSNQKDKSNPVLESAEEKKILQESPCTLKTDVITSDKNPPNDITKIDSEQVITTPKETITDIISHEMEEKTSPNPDYEIGTCLSDNGKTPTTTIKQLTSEQGIETDLSKSAKPNDIEVCQEKDYTNCTSNDTEVNGLLGRKASEDTGNLSKDLLVEKQHSDLTQSGQSNGAKVQHDQCDTNGTHGTEVSGPLEGQKTEDTSSSKPIVSEKQCSDLSQCCKSNDVELQQDLHDNGTSNGTEVNDPLERQMTKDDSTMSKDCLAEKQHSDLSKNGKCNEVEVHLQQDKCDTNGTKVKDPLEENKSEGGSNLNDVNGIQDGKKSCNLECSDSGATVEA